MSAATQHGADHRPYGTAYGCGYRNHGELRRLDDGGIGRRPAIRWRVVVSIRHLDLPLSIGKNRKRFFRYRASFPAAKSAVFAAYSLASLRPGR
jgi:hypothetical protein